MSLAPRCPQCRVPLRVTRLCDVCATGIPVQRVEPRILEPLPPKQLLAALQDLCVEENPPPKEEPPPPPKERVTTVEIITLPCETPDCRQEAMYNADGLRRLRAKAQPARCLACRATRRKETMNEAWTRYKTKHAL